VAERREFASGYATRVIPLDMLYLFVLGSFLGIAGAKLADMNAPPMTRIPVWVWWALPVVYIMCDFAEDTLILILLTWPSTVDSLACAALAAYASGRRRGWLKFGDLG